MAYNNGFPATYQQYYPQFPQPQMQMQQMPQVQQVQNPVQVSGANNGIIWVQGEAGAKSYLVAPNATVQLWDSESQTIYLKSADASGMPSMKILDYTIRDKDITVKETANYATKEDIERINKRIEALEKIGYE